MYFRIIHITILIISVLNEAICDKNVTQETKSKRGIPPNVVDVPEYSVLPIRHVGTYTQVRSLAPDETPLVDITYKSLENGYQNQYVPVPSEPPNISSDNAYDAQTYHPQQLAYDTLYPNPQQYYQPQALQTLPLYGSSPNISPLPYPTNSYLSSTYPINLNNKFSNPLSPYAAQKSLHLPSPQLKKNSPLTLQPYSTLPAVYGSNPGSLSTLKYAPTNLNYGLPIQSYKAPQPIKLIQPYHIKSPHKIIQTGSHPYRPAHIHNSQVSSSPIFQISQNFKSLEPNFFEPQTFDNPVVPQLQHFIPASPSPFDAFTKPVQPAAPNKEFVPSPQIRQQNSQSNTENSEEDEDSDEDDEGGNRKVKEEIKGEIYHHEVNDEDDFNKGYRDSARGLPAYDSDEDHDDEDYGKHRHNHGGSNGRYENYKSSHHYDSDHDDHADNYRDYTRRPHDYEDDRRGRYYSDHDTEGHYSNNNHKKEPRGHSHRETYKYHKKAESDTYQKKPNKQHEKKYSSTKPSSYRKQSDSRYAGDTIRTQNTKAPSRTQLKQTTPYTKSTRPTTEPSYQYGFEPVKTPYGADIKQVEEDQVGKYSSNKPLVKNKIHRENWYVSKTTEV